VVVPDNVLFEGGAGETVRRRLLEECDVHTLLRLPTGVFYAQGVKANVLFFDRKPASETAWTRELWVYDLRTNQHFTLKQNALRYEHLQDFVAAFSAREESERYRRFTYEELLRRDKLSLDLVWLRDESLEDLDHLPPPDVIAQEIVEDLEAALAEFSAVVESLGPEGRAFFLGSGQRHGDELELDPVGVVEEDGVVAREVGVLLRRGLDLGVAGEEPLVPLVDDRARRDLDREVMEADPVAVELPGRLRLPEADARPGPNEVGDRLAPLPLDLAHAVPAEGAEELAVEGKAALDRGDDEVEVVDPGRAHRHELAASPGQRTARLPA
jgi:hypothetical protein